MLKVGDRVVIGGKLASEFSYNNVVGMQGTIKKLPRRNRIGEFYQVDLNDGDTLPWCIQIEDCIPCSPKNNKDAKILLEEHY